MNSLVANPLPDHNDRALPPLLALVGPTASGKSRAALRLAQALPIEIVNADSRALYRGMDIGTAKPSPADRDLAAHHLVDILDPTQLMTLAMFQDLAMNAIRDIHTRGRIPMMVGGTPQYTNAIVEGWIMPRVEPDPDLRRDLEARAEEEGVAALRDELASVDPLAAGRVGLNLRRIVRAIEVFHLTGQPISSQQGKQAPPFRTLEIELVLPREVLHQRIARRVEKMIDAGLAAEVRNLLDAGIPRDAPALSSIGYRQLFPYLDGEQSLDTCIQAIIADTNRLVRHQQTWFRRNSRARRIDTSDDTWYATLLAIVRAFLDSGA